MTDTDQNYSGFSAEEKAAMKDHAKDAKKAAARRGTKAEKAAAAERDLLAKIAEMPDADRVLAERVHTLVTTAAPDLAPRLWYGMPAYAKDGRILCHFQAAAKFKTRYATLGFSDEAALDDGTLWPVAFALTELTPADEEFLTALLKRATA
ncbi:iron chaperone [Streptomyces sp. NPDC060194]|uniref:iron chaperone n=1 Tax=Streptomyces sp. NPDC060194 TaxID=3347069 RepID=UPI00365EE9F2